MATNNAINKKSASITFDGTNILSSFITTTSFIPEISFAGGQTGITYVNHDGMYSRIGNIVFFTIGINLTSKGSDTGALRIQALPVTPAQQGYCVAALGNVTYTGENTYGTISTSNYILIYFTGNASQVVSTIADTHCDNNLQIRCQGFYFV